MGCDIHGWVEVYDNGKWIAVRELKDDSRNYKRFALLAGVRDYDNENKIKPKGIPSDVSDTTNYHIREFDVDGHSHSYIPLIEAVKIFSETAYKPAEVEKLYPMYGFFGIDEDEVADKHARLVFWFDN